MAGMIQARLLWLRLQWEAGRIVRVALSRFGWAGLLGIAAICIAAVLEIHVVRQATQEAELIDRALVAGPSSSAEPRSREEINQQRMATFYDYLPLQSKIPDTVQRLIELGRTHHLLLKTGDYRAQSDAAGDYLGYRIALPVKGDASAIQDFLLAALEQHKTLSLESVAFKRERIESRDVEARIQFVMLTRVPGAIQSARLETPLP